MPSIAIIKEGIVINTESWQGTSTFRSGWSSEITKICLAVTDFVVVTFSFFIAERFLDLSARMNIGQATPLLLAFLWPFIYWREGLYPGYGLSRPEKFQKYIIGALLAGWLLLVLKPFISLEFHLTYPYLILSTALSVFITYPTRLLTQRILFKLGVWGEPVIVFGAGETGKRIVAILADSPLSGLIPVALFDDDIGKMGSRIEGIPVLGRLSDAGVFAKEKKIHHAIIAIPRISHDVLNTITSGQGQVFTKVQFIPHMRGLPVHSVGVSSIDNYLALEFYNNLRLRRNQFFKRLIDLVGTVLGGLVIAPVLLLLALLIKLDSKGSVVYTQKRLGRGGKHFMVFKFRSMVQNADEVLKNYLEEHPELQSEWKETHKLKNDPRIT